jgi:mannose-1-phosphate guanylyltransferase
MLRGAKDNNLSTARLRLDPQRAAIILAGGDGMRLRSLTRKIAGVDAPKQFCAVLGEQTLLEQTINRVALEIEERFTLITVNHNHKRFYGPVLAAAPAHNIVVQPQNRGTAPAILYSLLRLAEIAPQAHVAIFPSDHFVGDNREFMRQVDVAFNSLALRPELTVLLGIAATGPETGYGWIEAASAVSGTPLFMVRRFWEKPSTQAARELFRRGCLWNSFVMVGQLSTLLELFQSALPALYLSFKMIRPTLDTIAGQSAIDRLYARLDCAGFSEDILAHHPVNLAVLPVHGVDWSDLGEPHRVMDTIARMGVQPRWAAA